MKKFIALLAVCGFALAFVACGQKKEEAATEPETEQAPAPALEEEAPADTTAVPMDTTDQ